jgi:hypothetical protein
MSAQGEDEVTRASEKDVKDLREKFANNASSGLDGSRTAVSLINDYYTSVKPDVMVSLNMRMITCFFFRGSDSALNLVSFGRFLLNHYLLWNKC